MKVIEVREWSWWQRKHYVDCWQEMGNFFFFYALIGLFPLLLTLSFGHFLKLLMLSFFLRRTVSRFLKDTDIVVGPIRIRGGPPVKSIVSIWLCKQISMTSPRSSPTLRSEGGKSSEGKVKRQKLNAADTAECTKPWDQIWCQLAVSVADDLQL